MQKVHGSVTCRSFRKPWKTDQPTKQRRQKSCSFGWYVPQRAAVVVKLPLFVGGIISLKIPWKNWSFLKLKVFHWSRQNHYVFVQNFRLTAYFWTQHVNLSFIVFYVNVLKAATLNGSKNKKFFLLNCCQAFDPSPFKWFVQPKTTTFCWRRP